MCYENAKSVKFQIINTYSIINEFLKARTTRGQPFCLRFSWLGQIRRQIHFFQTALLLMEKDTILKAYIELCRISNHFWVKTILTDGEKSVCLQIENTLREKDGKVEQREAIWSV